MYVRMNRGTLEVFDRTSQEIRPLKSKKGLRFTSMQPETVFLDVIMFAFALMFICNETYSLMK